MGLKEYVGKVTVGDCIERMKELPDNYVDSVITDPPYEIGFMGKSWDNTGIAFNVEVWAECLRVAKPGAFLLAFGGTRTWHRIACAIEDAGWTLRDTIAWHYGSGFPKSLDISKALDKQAGAEREVTGVNQYAARRPHKEYEHSQKWGSTLGGSDTAIVTAPSTELAKTFDGYGTALKPSFEPIMVFMKPCDGTFAQNAEKWGLAGLNIDGGRISLEEGDVKTGGFGLGNRPFVQGAIGNNTRHETTGRWPANTILSCACEGEHAEDCPVRIMDEQSGVSKSQGGRINKKSDSAVNCVPSGNSKAGDPGYGDTGGASRFFYCAKPSRAEKEAGLEGFEGLSAAERTGRKEGSAGLIMEGGKANPYAGNTADRVQTNTHATVKPISLMRYLCKLTRPPHGGIVLDPFTGSGTTGIAAILEGRDFIGFELSQEYCDIANARIEHHRKSLIKEYDEEL